MAKFISQETFDDAVKENMETFDMSEEDAEADAKKQFEAQGVDLSRIITQRSTMSASVDVGSNCIQNIRHELANKTPNPKMIQSELAILISECSKSLELRVALGNLDLYPLLIQLAEKAHDDVVMLKSVFSCLIALMTTQPDLLNDAGIHLMINTFRTAKDKELIKLNLQWIKECCIKHEFNRQHIFDAKVLDYLKKLLENDVNAAMLRDVCGVLRALVLDDDIRVEYGRSHEHARVIASDTLCSITALLPKFKTDAAVVSDLMITLVALLVRNEFCKKVEDAGGLQFILESMKDFKGNEKICRQSLKLLKTLAGNDDCKKHIIDKGAAPLISDAIENHKSCQQLVTIGLGLIASLTLRNPENSKVLFDAGFPLLIIECMRKFPDVVTVQRNGSWAIRNMVSRSRYQCPHFIKLGAEQLLKQNLQKFDQNCEYDTKAALRDLGCDVDLKEEWTGKGGAISSQSRRK